MDTNYQLIAYETLKNHCQMLFERMGFAEQDSETITNVLLEADLRGFESHGVQRLVRYWQELRSGVVDQNASPAITHETPLSAVVDGRKAMGQLVGVFAMNLAIAKAQAAGIGLVSVRNSNHYGIAGYYTHMAADQGLMGISMTNTEAIMVPTFGRRAMLGTNPIALAVPAEPTVFSFDASTTVVPRGRLEVYNKRSECLPEGWVLDERGMASQDAGCVLDNIIHKRGGGILPLGGAGEEHSGYKGYGFGMICELFTGVLSGGLTSNHVNRSPGHTGIAHFFGAISLNMFGEKEALTASLSRYLDEIRASALAEGQDRVYVHGDKEAESRIRRLREGIPVNNRTMDELINISCELGASWN